LEIVTEADMRSAQEAKTYAQKLQQIARYLKVSDADMEKGSMRIEPNISLRKVSQVSEESLGLPPYKVELKNINSFKFAEKAIEYEIRRQAQILDRGEIPIQETRGWNEREQKTISQRTKELAHDYRYFPEPDLPPLKFSAVYLKTLEKELPELPDKKLSRFQKQYGLSVYDSQVLTKNKSVANFFEEATRAGKTHALTPKQIANTIINKKPDIEKILPASFVKQIYTSSQVAGISDDELDKIVKEVLVENIKATQDYKKGKENVLMFLIGQVVRKAGKIDSKKLTEKIKKAIG
ncbi:MAG: Aspartyl/glutamyl-tRNA(Asn/Gln) amidotransferase subunit B, partial [Candidatus Curtissbacteria bacterium GW2011_GWA1_40_16]